jgi:hypothetical protein
MPGIDPLDAMRMVVDTVGDLPFLPELPERGVGADPVGRAAALLADLPVDLTPSGWRLVGRPGRDLRRSRDLLRADLDAAAEVLDGYRGPLKIAVCGPWSLAAAVELPHGDKVLGDPGAIRDLADSLAEGLRSFLAELAGAVPGARPLLHLDEPSLQAVLDGTVRTASGFGRLPAPEVETAGTRLGVVVAVLDGTGVRCPGPRATGEPLQVALAAGARWFGLDMTHVTPRDDDPLGEALEAGIGLLAGVLDPDRPPERPDAAARPLRELWHRLGMSSETLLERVAVTPTRGLAGCSPSGARAALEATAAVARLLREEGA